MSNIFLKFLAGIAALALLGGIFYMVFFYDFTGGNIFFGNNKDDIVQQEAENVEEVVTTPVVENNIQEPVQTGVSANEIGAESLKRIAFSFAERFGSYSNHSGYSNVLDLKIFMTKSMQIWADNFVEEATSKKEYSAIYYGITTKAILAEIQKYDDDAGQADILVKTQRRESTGEIGNASISYQDILISFIQEGGSWKVNKAEWQEK
ncbi:MAG: hypothetical protein WC582_00430 [Patescibacteria group bacterium]